MKKTVLALTLATLGVPAFAQDKKAPEPDYTISGNFSVTSDYRFRGISQTNEKPALQLGVDLGHSSGVYIGSWTSNVHNWANVGGQQEIDLYGGLKRQLLEIPFEIGVIAYTYPRNNASPSQNTYEYYFGITLGPFSYKINQSTGNWFGVDAQSATYHDLAFTYSVTEKLIFGAHIGQQRIKETGVHQGEDYGFNDYRISLTYDIGNNFNASLAGTRVTFNNQTDGTEWYTSNTGKRLGGSTALLTLTKTF